MAAKTESAVNKDFLEVVEFLKTITVLSVPMNLNTLSVAKQIHAATYSLILWKFRLKGLTLHSKPFIEEIASDALQILPQILLGYGKTAKLLARGILENTMRNIFFSDHPIEFALMNQDTKWFMDIKSLTDYLKKHPVFAETESSYDAINRLSTLYSELSAGIHGRRVADLEMRTALQAISFSQSAAALEAVSIKKCAEVSNFLLAAYHLKKMKTFSIEDRRIILRTLPKSARKTLGNLEGLDA